MSNSLYPAIGAAGQTDPIDVRRNGKPSKTHTLMVFPAGSPTVLTYSLWGTTKHVDESPVWPSDYVALTADTDGTTTKAVFAVDKPVNTVVCKCSAISGGSTPSVRFGYANA